MHCDRQYKPKDEGIPLLKRGSKKVGCKYMAILKGTVAKGVVGEWTIKLSDGAGKGTHSGHPQLTKEGLMPYFQARRFTQSAGVAREINNMIEAGSKPREILVTIKRHTSQPLPAAGDQKSKNLEDLLKGRSPLTALLDDLAQSVDQGVVTDVIQNEQKVLTHLFFQTDESDEAWLQARDQLDLDRTVVLREFFGRDQIEPVGDSELRTLGRLIWMDLERAPTEEKFLELWEQMEKDVDKDTYNYLEKNKIPLRRHWASAYIDKYQHLSATVTSRVEGKRHRSSPMVLPTPPSSPSIVL
ncbi:hypothetical protein DFS34DRAFT_689925 [Phlyctochytrium arcticum]|nr:hypothetical protein DFS34DRAFT_689925 [Phlyctochytrium arcticum]